MDACALAPARAAERRMSMNGSGCKNCPVKPCETMNYRGSVCAAQRARFGLGDPKTNADRIRATDDELATMLHAVKMGYAPWCDYHCENEGDDGCDNCIKQWLKQPAEGD